MVDTVEGLQAKLPKTEIALKKLGRDTADLISEVDSKISSVFAGVGQADSELLKQAPSPQVWGCVGSLLNSMADLDGQYATLSSDLTNTHRQLETQKSTAKKSGEVAEGLKGFVSRVYEELLHLKQTSGSGGLSNEVIQEITRLQTRLAQVEHQNQMMTNSQD